MPIESKPGAWLSLGLSVGRECENKNEPRVQPVIFTRARAHFAKKNINSFDYLPPSRHTPLRAGKGV